MRRTLDKGAYIKVIDPAARYEENVEMAEKLGADKKKLNLKTPAKNQTGTVLGIEEGFVLVDFGDFQYLMDIDGVEITKKPEEIKLLVRYMHNNTLEEYSTEEEIQKRMTDLVKAGSMNIGQDVKVYSITGSKSLKMKLNVFLE